MAKPAAPILEFVDPGRMKVRDADFSSQERRILDEVNRRVASGQSLDSVMNFVFDTTRDIFPCDRIGLAFLQDDGRRVVAYWARAQYEPLVLTKEYAQDLRGSSLAAVLKTNRVRIINDLEAYLHRKPQSEATRLLVQEGVRSSMTCPLVVERRPIGFLFRSSRRPYAYTHRETALHLAMAERLSQAVEKAYRIEQLEAANRAYFEMLGFVSHELKSPLASVVMDARMLTEGYLGDLAPKQKEKAGRIIQKVEYLLNLVREYLDLARVEGGQIRVEPRPLDFRSEVLEPSIDIVRAQIEEKEMELVVSFPEHSEPVQCDLDLMRVVVVNLLGNAVKYGYAKGAIRVVGEISQGMLRVTIRNSGPGFPPSERYRLFRKFSRIPTPELLKEKGTGVGLYTTWQIIQRHEGTVRADSEPGEWAEFTFEIPTRQKGVSADSAREEQE